MQQFLIGTNVLPLLQNYGTVSDSWFKEKTSVLFYGKSFSIAKISNRSLLDVNNNFLKYTKRK